MLAIALIMLRLSAVPADDEAESPAPSEASGDDDTDLDMEEDFEDAESPQLQGGGGPMAGGPPRGYGINSQAPEVEDFDLEFTEDDRSTRMGTCFSYTIGRMQARREMMSHVARGIMSEHGVEEQQAITAVLSNWMMACYMNIASEEMDQAIGTPFGSPVETPADKDQELFSQSPSAKQTAQQASERQWRLLETTLKESAENVPESVKKGPQQNQQQQQQQQQQQHRDSQGARGQPQAGLPGSSMDTETGFIYMIAVFVVLFGIGTLVVLKLNVKENGKAEKDRGSKSEKKKEKAEKMAAKKRM